MFVVYEVNTGEVIAEHNHEGVAWSHATSLNDARAEAYGLEYTVRRE